MAGIPDALYWRATDIELTALLLELKKKERREMETQIKLHGMTAAAVYNVNRKKGARLVKPSDFVPRRARRMSLGQFHAMMRGFAAEENAARRSSGV